MLNQIVYIVFLLFTIESVLGQNDCTSTGVQCSVDCKQVVLCPSEGSVPILVRQCYTDDTPKFCLNKETVFTCDGTYCNNPNITRPFKCTGAGAFPSAFNCQNYYMCLGANQDPALECKCTGDEKYDAAKQTCTADGACTNIPADCTDVGKPDQPIGDGTFCYICLPDRNTLVYHCGSKPLVPSGDVKKPGNCQPYKPPPEAFLYDY